MLIYINICYVIILIILNSSIGIYKTSQLEGFINTFSVIVILEKFKEGLIMIKHLLVRGNQSTIYRQIYMRVEIELLLFIFL